MRSKEHQNGRKIVQSLQSAEVGVRVQIAVVENTSAGADCL